MAAFERTPSPRPNDSQRAAVLVVEDEPAIVEAICTGLEDAGISAGVCPLGWQAHHCIRDQQPKIVIFDVRLPSVDGIQLFYTLRADPKTRNIPVIFLTANPRKVEVELPNYVDLGARLIPKPFDFDTLLDQVSHAIAE